MKIGLSQKATLTLPAGELAELTFQERSNLVLIRCHRDCDAKIAHSAQGASI